MCYLLHCTNRVQKTVMEMKGSIIKTPQCLVQAPCRKRSDLYPKVSLLKSSQREQLDQPSADCCLAQYIQSAFSLLIMGLCSVSTDRKCIKAGGVQS